MEIALYYVITATLNGFAMAIGHYFPWPKLLGRELSRPECYIYGTLWSAGLPTLFLVIADQRQIHVRPIVWAGLYVVALISAGVVTLAAYQFDALTGGHRHINNDEELDL